MPCYHPMQAYQAEDGKIVFDEIATKKHGGHLKTLTLPCGRCIGCRLKRTKSWAIRCMHEAQMHNENSFITLTYNDEHYKLGLDYTDFQKFLDRMRKHKGRPTRYFAAGEYGDISNRPHWHALLFGTTFPNLQQIGDNLWRSPELEQLWPYGFSSIGEVTFQSAAYVASYCTKKVNGPLAAQKYTRVNLQTGQIEKVQPEMARMSLKPGIGANWLRKYWPEVYAARDGVTMKGGFTMQAPRYYDKLMEKQDPETIENKQYERYKKREQYIQDSTQDRLTVREKVATAKLNQKQRKLR